MERMKCREVIRFEEESVTRFFSIVKYIQRTPDGASVIIVETAGAIWWCN